VLVVPRGQTGQVKTTVQRKDPLMAPINKGQTMATLKIQLGGQPWQDVPLQALEAVPSAGFLGRAWDALRLSIQ
jgi:D-alanyl-D-alanine carboxypeptidase (penicillin-binding protein 5/6)